MDEQALRALIQRVKDGRLSRRRFTQSMVGLGLGAPLASQMLAAGGVSYAQSTPAPSPAKRGGGGSLKTLWTDAQRLINPILAVGLKDYDGARIFYEPLASFDPDGTLVPVLAAELPTVQNGAIAKDGRSITWKLKRDVVWHDGKPFTAADVVFTWEYAADPATGSPLTGSFQEIDRVEALDRLTVKVVYKEPTPVPYTFCGLSMIIPKHLFEAYRGDKAREAPTNLKPVGTGPYRHVDFKPGDVIRAELNPTYHVPNRPFFDTLEVKGGGDAASAARAVLQTGEYDYAWNMQVEDEILKRLETSGKGKIVTAFGGNVEKIELNQTDPLTEIDGERSSMKAPHPLLTDLAVRSALNVLVDRAALQEHIYGRSGAATANVLNGPPRFRSANTKWEFSIQKANDILEAAEWKRGPDGIRAKGGKKLKFVFQTSTNAPRQKTQAIVKQAAAKAGIGMDLKSVVASSYFSSDPSNPDTYTHFYTDLQMFQFVMARPDPEFFMRQFVSWEIASKAKKWQGYNTSRWRSEDFDRLFTLARTELDPVKRATLFIKMNDLLIHNVAVIPIVWRAKATAISNTLRGTEQTAWDSDFWRLAYWQRAT